MGKGKGLGKGDYEVGYGKPPKAYQFEPGKSGNPKGRKKGSRGLKTDLHAELSSTLTISINKQPVSGTKQRLMLKSLATRAAAGDVRASTLLIPLILQIFGFEDRGSERRTLSRQDQALLEELLAGASGAAQDEEPLDPASDGPNSVATLSPSHSPDNTDFPDDTDNGDDQ